RVSARRLLVARACARPEVRLRPRAETAGRLLLFPATVGRQRLQAAEPVPALDGPSRRAGSRRLEANSTVEADRSARYARDSRRALPAADALCESWLAHGARHHCLAAAARSGRPGQVRLRPVPHRDDERMRLQSWAG